jgi:hypothetical protein
MKLDWLPGGRFESNEPERREKESKDAPWPEKDRDRFQRLLDVYDGRFESNPDEEDDRPKEFVRAQEP